MNFIPENAARYGLSASATGAHGGRTLMLAELTLLLNASENDANFAALRTLVVEDNVLLKSTGSSRTEALGRLRSLYGLDTGLVVWRVLRELWTVNEDDRPLLALLCALGRDGLLRATAQTVAEQPLGATVTPQMLETAVNGRFPERYSPTMLASVGRNTISSWTQSGHLESRRVSGKEVKTRVHVQAGVGAVAYALFLGYLCGSQGVTLYRSPGACPCPAALDE